MVMPATRAGVRARCAAMLATSAMAASVAAAQGAPRVAGTVLDDAGRPVPAIDVTTDGGTRTVTDSLGRFGLVPTDCEPVRVGVRRPGSITTSRVVQPCTQAAQSLELVLRPIGTTLGTVRTTARTSGFVGIVTDVEGTPLPRAVVRLVGGRRSTTTDSAGRFALLGADSGTYMLRVTAPGRRHGRLTTTLGTGDVREVQFLLTAIPAGLSRRDSTRLARGDDDVQLREFEARRINRGPTTTIVTREELMAADDGRRILACALARVPSVWRAVPGLTLGRCGSFEACVLVRGRWSRDDPLWGYDTDAVEMVELYGPGTDAANTIGIRALDCRDRATAVVWLRR